MFNDFEFVFIQLIFPIYIRSLRKAFLSCVPCTVKRQNTPCFYNVIVCDISTLSTKSVCLLCQLFKEEIADTSLAQATIGNILGIALHIRLLNKWPNIRTQFKYTNIR